MNLLLSPLLPISRVYGDILSNMQFRIIQRANDQSVAVSAALFGIDASVSLQSLHTVHDESMGYDQLSAIS
jgi:hypothetical protein